MISGSYWSKDSQLIDLYNIGVTLRLLMIFTFLTFSRVLYAVLNQHLKTSVFFKEPVFIKSRSRPILWGVTIHRHVKKPISDVVFSVC